MKVRVLSTKDAPSLLTRLFGQVLSGPAPTVTIRRSQIPYWQERGWRQKLRTGPFIGCYRAGPERFRGQIDPSTHEFLIHRPPEALRAHPHWICFRYQEHGWYLVHFARRPQDMSAALTQRLSQLPADQRDPSLTVGAEFANKIFVKCP